MIYDVDILSKTFQTLTRYKILIFLRKLDIIVFTAQYYDASYIQAL